MPKNFLVNLAALGAADMMPYAANNSPLLARVVRRVNRGVHGAGVTLAATQGGAYYQDTPDRLLLENVIIPFYQLSPAHKNILFVGCDWYTAGYARRFALKSYSTIDADPKRARYGAAHHQVGAMKYLGTMHAEGTVDLVMCNGVIGWGLNELAEAEASFAAAFKALRPGGHLVIGWNDLPQHSPFELARVEALRRFERYVFPPLGADRYAVDHELRHNYEFFAKPA